jgi:hypothetical protein
MTPAARLLTPAEYRDAFRFWTEQDTPTRALEVEVQLLPHVIRVEAEQVRRLAVARYGDAPEDQAARLKIVNRDADIIGDVRARRPRAAA